MRIFDGKQHTLIVCFFTLILLGSSCADQPQSSPIGDKIPDEGNARKPESKIDSTFRLKFTSGIRSILEDSRGNIWFGSHQEGLCMFDGEKLTYFTEEDGLSSNQVRSIFEDASGRIWLEGGKGLSSYNGQKIITQQEKDYNSKLNWKIAKDDLWFKGDEATGYNEKEGAHGVYRYDGKTLSYRQFPLKPKADEEFYYSVSTPFFKGKSGMLWFGTYGAVIGYDGLFFKILDNERLGRNEETGFLHIRSIFEDSRGNLWIGNNGIGVFRYDGDTIINFTEKYRLRKEDTNGHSLDRIFSIGEDDQGNIWFGTVESGVWRYDGGSLTNFTGKDGIDCGQIWTIYKSKQGEMWFGGASPSGVYKFNGSSFERIF